MSEIATTVKSRHDAPPPEPPPDELASAVRTLPDLTLTGTDEDAQRVRSYLEAGRSGIEARHRNGAAGRTVVRLHSALMDRLLREAWAAQGAPGGAALAAIGGYGRSELAPWSDIDLLFLHTGAQDAPDPAVRTATEGVLYLLWDAGLQVGHAVRTVDACLEVANADHTARTALLDCRRVAGDRGLYQRFEAAILGQVHTRRVEGFVDDKLTEWRERHDRFGDTVFRLEPDVKNGEGGLRDLHTALWLARVVFHVAGVRELGQRMLLPRREIEDLKAARDFLWRVRNGLHYRAGRRQDHLTFDAQEDLARAFGYLQWGHALPVERFMRDYYLSARSVVRIGGHVIERCTEGRHPWAGGARSTPVEPGFKTWQGRLTVTDPQAFREDPAAMVRLFEVADRRGLPLYSFARDLVREGASRIDEGRRSRPEVAEALRSLFCRPGTRGAFLRPMHDAGLLGALVPEFGRQTGLWQHDLYHTYTVDVHSLFAVQRLMELRAGLLSVPRFSEEMAEVEDPWTLYLGTWFHDLGKGLGGHHSEKGAAMMPAVGARLGLTAEEVADVTFLVTAHLRMSHLSQRRDLSDPDLIADFAEEVGSLHRLRMLYLLTFADASTTGENTWTDWKAQLLSELYERTREALGRSAAGKPVPRRGFAALARAGAPLLVERLCQVHPREEVESFVSAVPDRYLANVTTEEAAGHLDLLLAQDEAGVAVRRRARPERGCVELSVAAPDRPGLLADLTAALTAERLDILAAEIFSLADGRILDQFLVREADGGLLGDPGRWEVVHEALVRAAREAGAGEGMLVRRMRRSGLKPRAAPPVPVEVRIDDDASEAQTVIDVFARDRVGLLHAITHTLRELGLSVSVARIATEAHRATDAFYVTGADGLPLVDAGTRAEVVDRLRGALTEFEAQAEAGGPRTPG